MILMDTHIWLRWLLPDEPLSENLIELIETTEYLAVSSISCWEIVLLEKLHRIELPLHPVFKDIQKVNNSGLFSDTSRMKVNGVAISVNMTAIKPVD